MQNKLKRRITWTTSILLSIVILLVVLIFSLPTLTKWYATNWLEAQGVSASIEDISLKLLDGQIRVKALRAIGPKKHKIELGEIIVQLHLRDLLDNKVTIEKIEFSDFYVDIFQQLGNSIEIGDISFGKSGTLDTKEDKQHKESAAWEFVLKDIDFKNFESCVKVHNQQGNPLYNNCLTLDEFTLDGQSSFILDTRANDEPGKLGANISLVLKNLRLHGFTDASEIVSVGILHLKDLNVDGFDSIKIGSLKLDDYAILQRAKKGTNGDTHVANIEHITLTTININKLNEFIISQVDIDGLQTYLFRNQQGDFEPIYKVRQLLFPETMQENDKLDHTDIKKRKDKQKPVFKINNLTIVGDSKVTAKDEGIKPHFLGTARDIKVQMSQIDSSAPGKPSPVKFSFVVGDHGKVNFDGNIALFAERPTGKLKGTIRAVNAADFSAYLNGTLQHRIKSGHVDADIDLVVVQGKLDSKFNFKFHKLYLEELNEEKSKQYIEALGVPLTVALNLLREKDDSIKLNLPVTGDIESPDFSLNDTIQKVMVDAIKTAVIDHFIPFGLVITVATTAFDLATALRLDPVYFEPIKTNLDEEDKQHLEKLITMLTERPNINLVVCGHTTLDDRFKLFPVEETVVEQIQNIDPHDEELDVDINSLLPKLSDKELTKLNEIAKQRGETVRNYLSKEKGIDATRMIMCNPKYENDQSKPRVVISL